MLPAVEWELPESKTMDVIHGPRAISLNQLLLTERWSDSKMKPIAQMIYQAAGRLLGVDDKGGFQSSKLPGGKKRDALNHQNYVTAILKKVAKSRAKAYQKLRREQTTKVKDGRKTMREIALLTKNTVSEEEDGYDWKDTFAKTKSFLNAAFVTRRMKNFTGCVVY